MEITILDINHCLHIGILADILERYGSETEIIVVHSINDIQPCLRPNLEIHKMVAPKIEFDMEIVHNNYVTELKKPIFKGHERPYKYHK